MRHVNKAGNAFCVSQALPHFTQQANGSSDTCHAHSPIPAAWTGHKSSSNTQLPFTREVQAILWMHQHPVRCDDARFLVYSAPSSLGIGAKLDFLAAALGRALDLGRVLLIDYEDRWVDGSFCIGFPTMDTCFFEPLSSCGLTDIYQTRFVTSPELYGNITLLQEMRSNLSSPRILFEQGHTFSNEVPFRVANFVDQSAILPHTIIGGVASECYWWRAQGVAYVLRPNLRTLSELAMMRPKYFNEDIGRGTISIHVRHGDKHRDNVPPMPNEKYHAVASQLLATSGGSLQPKYFVSTEDPDTILYFEHVAGRQVQYTKVRRDNHAGGSPMSVVDPSMEMLLSLLNLDLALQRDAWVCTLASLWCTLIDRLRSTVRCKASGKYGDAHDTLEGLGHV